MISVCMDETCMRAVSGERRAESGDLESGEQKLCKNRKDYVLNIGFAKYSKEYSRNIPGSPKNSKLLGTYFRGLCGH